ncbi:MAG: CsbD family protein [Candidatus Dormibacteraeota bacterium]|nr:CsbD family protein [Candidatus Dormibacteraeota bacterium]
MGGEADKLAGRVKEAAGDLTDDSELKGEGKTQQAAGDVKNVGEKVKDKADELGDKIKE